MLNVTPNSQGIFGAAYATYSVFNMYLVYRPLLKTVMGRKKNKRHLWRILGLATALSIPHRFRTNSLLLHTHYEATTEDVSPTPSRGSLKPINADTVASLQMMLQYAAS